MYIFVHNSILNILMQYIAEINDILKLKSKKHMFKIMTQEVGELY